MKATIFHEHGSPDFHKEVWNLTDRRGVDIVVDSVGEELWREVFEVIPKDGS